ncbi:hypothetical protein RclHR1_05540013 [Rhizophagus clarus]|uniref:Uncharacterized protein n=1 Tax=Rhizophagus clarus TaxID=94130 RepID=A0A2Z6S4U5_9GLOM|nr:hypothetical protein RclHR1_05540013 [Rhizophagus clarus]GES90763.1 hypothetical protein GLOIN_2v1671527 [Rhizophagus clarus]
MEWPELLNPDYQILGITVEQRQIFLDALEKEMRARIQRLRREAEVHAKRYIARCEKEINSLPKEIRQMPLDVFINIYHADPSEYFEKQRNAYDAQITSVTPLNSKRTWASRYLNKKAGNEIESESLSKKRTGRDIIRPIVAKKELSENKVSRNKSSHAKHTRLDKVYNGLRYPEPGERIISLQGTPIFNPFSIFKNEKKDNPFIVGGKGSKPLVIPLEDGKIIESPSQIQEMTHEKKREVKDKIMLLQKELNKFSSELNK